MTQVQCSEPMQYTSWRTYQRYNLLAQADSVYRRHWDQMFPLSSFLSWFSVCSINLNQLRNRAVYARYDTLLMASPWGTSDITTYSSLKEELTVLFTLQWRLIVVHTALEAAVDPADDWVCVRGRHGHKESAKNDGVKASFMFFFPLFCFFLLASLIILLAADTAPPARSTPLLTSCSRVGIN